MKLDSKNWLERAAQYSFGVLLVTACFSVVGLMTARAEGHTVLMMVCAVFSVASTTGFMVLMVALNQPKVDAIFDDNQRAEELKLALLELTARFVSAVLDRIPGTVTVRAAAWSRVFAQHAALNQGGLRA